MCIASYYHVGTYLGRDVLHMYSAGCHIPQHCKNKWQATAGLCIGCTPSPSIRADPRRRSSALGARLCPSRLRSLRSATRPCSVRPRLGLTSNLEPGPPTQVPTGLCTGGIYHGIYYGIWQVGSWVSVSKRGDQAVLLRSRLYPYAQNPLAKSSLYCSYLRRYLHTHMQS